MGVLAQDHSGGGRGAPMGEQQQETFPAVTPGCSPLLSPGGTWIPSRGEHLPPPPLGLDGGHTPSLPANVGQNSQHCEGPAEPRGEGMGGTVRAEGAGSSCHSPP